MAVENYDLVTVQSDFITIDVIVWRRYRTIAKTIVELTLDVNPHLAILHRKSPFLPIGVQLRIPIDPEIMRGAPKARNVIMLFGKVK